MASLDDIAHMKLVITLADLKKNPGLRREIQAKLNALGLYDYGPNDPDGAWGARTERGLRKFCDTVFLNNFETGLFGPSFAEAFIEYNDPINPGRFAIPTWWQGGSRDELAKAVAKEGKNQGVIDRNQLCYIMATIQHETDHTFRPIAEYGGRNAWYAPYYGRGYVQLTHRFNYQAYSDKLSQDFVSYPDKVMDPAISLFVIMDGMKNGVFTGVKLDDYIQDTNVDFDGARRIVNDMDRYALIANYAREWQNTSLF